MRHIASMTERWSKTDYSVPASEAERDERIERQAGQYAGKGRVVLVVWRGGMPHIKIQEYKGKPQRKGVEENERKGTRDCDS